MTNASDDPNAGTKELMDKWAAMQTQHGPAIKELKKLEAKIKEAARLTPETLIESDFAEAVIAPGNLNVKWDGEKLDGYAVEHPDILDFRTEARTADRVSIKLKD